MEALKRYSLLSLVVVSLVTAVGLAFDLHPAPYPKRPVLYEDGSFVVYEVSGCIPWTPCSAGR